MDGCASRASTWRPLMELVRGPDDRTPPLRPPKSKAVRDRNVHDLTAPTRLLQIKLDWREHFRRWCELHGGNPVEVGGRLLAPDGWGYSATSYGGPEYPPPTD